MLLKRVAQLFENIGGDFVSPFDEIAEKLTTIKAFLFDWDGVFNAGYKGEGATSLYSEADSMGTNLLRFGYWLQNNELPFVGIITGQNNLSAFELAKRERFQAVYFHFNHKIQALQHLEKTYGIAPNEVAFGFDDVLDLSAAKQAGLRFLMRRNASPMFTDYVKHHKLCDYITGHEGSQYGVREVTELILGLKGIHHDVVEQRVQYAENYQNYLNQRNQQKTVFYTLENNQIVETTR